MFDEPRKATVIVIRVARDAEASDAEFGPAYKVVLGCDVLEAFPAGRFAISVNLGTKGFCITKVTAVGLVCYAFGQLLVKVGDEIAVTIVPLPSA